MAELQKAGTKEETWKLMEADKVQTGQVSEAKFQAQGTVPS